MTIIRTGATKKYASGWEQAFGKAEKKTKARAAAPKSKTKSTSAAKKKKKAPRKVKSL
jgi:hypothetical protein